MDRFDAIRTLLAAVDGGSLSAASRKLGMPLPTVSRKVSDLEAHLAPNLSRTSRKLRLTDGGSAFVMAVAACLRTSTRPNVPRQENTAPRAATFLVTASIMFGKIYLTPIIFAFLAAYQEVNVRVVLADHVIDLVENHIDVAVRIGRLPDSGLVATRVGDIHWVICASPAYLEAHARPATPDDLAHHRCIGFEGLQMVRTWPFGRGGDAGLSRSSRASRPTPPMP